MQESLPQDWQSEPSFFSLVGLPLFALDLSDYIHVTDSGIHSIAHMTRWEHHNYSETLPYDPLVFTTTFLYPKQIESPVISLVLQRC